MLLISTQCVRVICDAVARSNVKILLSKPHKIPYSWTKNTPFPEMKILMCGLWFWAHQEYPPPPKPPPSSKLLMEDFRYQLTKNTHPTPIGISHEEFRDFSSELTMNTPPPPHPSHLDWKFFGTSVLSLPRISSTPTQIENPPRLELLMEDLKRLWRGLVCGG